MLGILSEQIKNFVKNLFPFKSKWEQTFLNPKTKEAMKVAFSIFFNTNTNSRSFWPIECHATVRPPRSMFALNDSQLTTSPTGRCFARVANVCKYRISPCYKDVPYRSYPSYHLSKRWNARPFAIAKMAGNNKEMRSKIYPGPKRSESNFFQYFLNLSHETVPFKEDCSVPACCRAPSWRWRPSRPRWSSRPPCPACSQSAGSCPEPKTTKSVKFNYSRFVHKKTKTVL